MATRSTIAIEFADGSVSQIYCHWDGYLDNNGKILQKHYMDPFKVRDLIDCGSVSSLRESVEESKDNTGNPWPADRYMNVDEYFAECRQEEYDYILLNRNDKATWYVRYWDTQGNWIPVEMAVINEQDRIAQEETE